MVGHACVGKIGQNWRMERPSRKEESGLLSGIYLVPQLDSELKSSPHGTTGGGGGLGAQPQRYFFYFESTETKSATPSCNMLRTQEISNFVHDLVFRGLNHYIFHDENVVIFFTSGNLVTRYLTICGQYY